MSCKYCEELLSCPVGEKRKSIIKKEVYGTPTISEYETSPKDVPIPITQSLIEMVRDVYDKNEEIFIHFSTTDIYRNWSNDAFDINFCPMCGQALKEQSDD